MKTRMLIPVLCGALAILGACASGCVAPRRARVWVPGHYGPRGRWVKGHHKRVSPPHPGAVWVPGRRAPNGRWLPGHWK